jgi:signal transduction histidine kinase/ActR/RegA family two-component response regulator
VLTRKDGRTITLRISGRIKDDHQSHEDIMEAIAEDVSERRLLEEQFYQAQKMEAVGRLAGGVAHDFNNLLSVILGYSELLSTSIDPEKLKQVLQIKLAAGRAAALTTQLLAFSRRQVLYPRALDVNSTIAETDKMLRRLIGEDVHLRLQLAPKLWFTHADPAQVTQVLMNLAVNARDAMPKGGNLIITTGNVTLDKELTGTGTAVPPGDWILMSVSDTGVGMDVETQARIFDPFFTTKPEGKGTGLGLATVYGIVRQAGGHIVFSSELNRGTTFNLYLPRVPERIQPTAAQEEIVDVMGGTETILLAEDVSSLREFLCEALLDAGYKVLSATNGAEAVQVASGHDGSIDLLITDVIMPHTGGPDLARQVGDARPDIKVLYMSGYADDRLDFTRTLDADSYIQKPFTIAELTKKIRVLMGKPQPPPRDSSRSSS